MYRRLLTVALQQSVRRTYYTGPVVTPPRVRIPGWERIALFCAMFAAFYAYPFYVLTQVKYWRKGDFSLYGVLPPGEEIPKPQYPPYRPVILED